MMKKRKNKILLIAIISLIAIICALIYDVLNAQVNLNRTELLGIDDTQAATLATDPTSPVVTVASGDQMDSTYSFSLRCTSQTTTSVWRL